MAKNNSGDSLNFLKKKWMAVLTAATFALSAGACSKSDEELDVGYYVEDSSLPTENGLYDLVINREGLESDKYDLTNVIRTKNFAKVSEEKVTDTSVFDTFKRASRRCEILMIWPESISNYLSLDPYSFDFDCSSTVQSVSEFCGETYKVIYSSITAQKDFKKVEEDKIPLKKGDKMFSIAIIFNDEIVAYEQYGVGSECENGRAYFKGDVDLAISTVEELGLDEVTSISRDDLYDLQDEMNGKTLVLK